MAESMDDVRYDIENTRQRMSATLAELGSRIESRKEAVAAKVQAAKGRVDPEQVLELVRQHPLASLAVAFGVGALIARTGADRAIASTTAHAALSASHSTVDAARSAAGAVVEKVRGGDSDTEVPIHMHQDEGTLIDRLAGEVGRVIRIDELESDMRRAFVSQKLPTSI